MPNDRLASPIDSVHALQQRSPQQPILQQQIAAVRQATLALTRGWSAEDMALQSMSDASPAKWHLAHTSWFFEAMLLSLPDAVHDTAAESPYQPFDPSYLRLYNSYYEALGPRHPRPQRGLLSRPGLDEVLAYRAHVDAALARWLSQVDAATLARLAPTIELGLQHEMQHQELMVTDLLHAFSLNPLRPALWTDAAHAPVHPAAGLPGPAGWSSHPGGLVQVGVDPAAARADHHAGFAFDNETPRHPVWLQPFELADRPVSCADYLDFVRDGGYRRADLWLSDGWAQVQAQGWRAPAYWVAADLDPEFEHFGPHGLAPLDLAAPVSALSYYEADAYARWAGARLPTEFEWEAQARVLTAAELAADADDAGAGGGPGAAAGPSSLPGAGQVWEWTVSAYLPYPGFRPLTGAASEYNGKFMTGQMVLRGGSWATPAAQKRLAYRNFFPPGARWQFSGLRLARDGG